MFKRQTCGVPAALSPPPPKIPNKWFGKKQNERQLEILIIEFSQKMFEDSNSAYLITSMPPLVSSFLSNRILLSIFILCIFIATYKLLTASDYGIWFHDTLIQFEMIANPPNGSMFLPGPWYNLFQIVHLLLVS